MPKYRFTTTNGAQVDVGSYWLEFPDDRAASQEAQRALADMAKDELPDGAHLELRIAVENRAGDVVYQASLDFRGETAEQMRSSAAQANRASMNGGRRPREGG